MMNYSRVDEEKGEVYCCECGSHMANLVVSFGDFALRCLKCGKDPEYEDEEE